MRERFIAGFESYIIMSDIMGEEYLFYQVDALAGDFSVGFEILEGSQGYNFVILSCKSTRLFINFYLISSFLVLSTEKELIKVRYRNL